MESRFRALIFGSVVLITGCQGGASTNDLGSSVPAMGSGSSPAMVQALPPSGQSKPAPSASPTPISSASPAPSASPQVTASPGVLATTATLKNVYGLQLRKIFALDPLNMEYSERIAFAFPVGVDIAAFRSGLTISPATASYAEYPFVPSYQVFLKLPANALVSLALHFVPGVTYTITDPAFGINMRVSTPALTAASYPAPIVHKIASPYSYGFLNHPWAFAGFLGGFLYSPTDTRPNSVSARADSVATLSQIVQSGAGYVRMDFCSQQTIYTDTTIAPKWFHLDPILQAVTAAGITVLPIIQQHCAYSVVSGGGTMDTPEHYARWAGLVADHLKLFPTITRVELFNEPNLRGGWSPGALPYSDVSGAGAAPFMQAAYAAVKAANPNIMVVAGALASGGKHVRTTTWLGNAMSAGCKVGVCWDELSVHNYRWEEPSVATIANDPGEDNRIDIYKDLQNVAVAHGDPKPNVMLTEYGWSSCISLTVCFDPQVQALYIARSLNSFLADPSVDGITYVNIYNSSPDSPDYFWSNTALVNNDRTVKPGYSIFQQFAMGSH